MRPPSCRRQFVLNESRALGRIEIFRVLYLHGHTLGVAAICYKEVNSCVFRGEPYVPLGVARFDMRSEEVFTGMYGK